mgnify:CR=1 FL=1
MLIRGRFEDGMTASASDDDDDDDDVIWGIPAKPKSVGLAATDEGEDADVRGEDATDDDDDDDDDDDEYSRRRNGMLVDDGLRVDDDAEGSGKSASTGIL